jgi:putative membrane protein
MSLVSPAVSAQPAGMFLRTMVGITVAVQVVLGVAPKADRLTWALENAPVWIGLAVLAGTWRRFPLSRLCLGLLLVHGIILAVGGHWTYAKVPAGDWVKEWCGLARNHYDRLGHLAQGFMPAIFVRELLLRTSGVGRSRWLPFLAASVCLAFSACYEFIEWWTALIAGSGATEFLGTQGDPWDTQWDMFLCLLGAALSLTLLSRAHDRSLAVVSHEAIPAKVSG